MKIKTNHWLLLIFLVTLSFRLFFAFQTPYYSSDESYYNLRHIEYIDQNLKPMTYDDLSYGGRELVGLPLFQIIMSVFYWIPFAYKILPAVFMSLLVIIVFYLTKKITDDETSSLFSAFMAGFLPIVIQHTLNDLSIYTLILPLLFFMIYCLIEIDEEKYTNWFIFLSFILPLIHPISLIFSFGFLIYYILVITENMKISGRRKEAILFFLLLSLFIEFIIYKKVFMASGFSLFLQNIPTGLVDYYFKQANILDMILSIGILPFILGLLGLFYGIFKESKHSVLILSSIVFAAVISLLFFVVRFDIGLMILGISFVIISSVALDRLFTNFSKTKWSKHKDVFKYSIFILIALTLFIPSIFSAVNVLSNTMGDDEYQVFNRMVNETDVNSTVLTDIEEGNTMMYFTGRKSALDNNFLLVDNINQRYEELTGVYGTESSVKATQALKDYDVKYIYLSGRTKDKYNIEKLRYVQENDKCFKKVIYVGRTEVYKISC